MVSMTRDEGQGSGLLPVLVVLAALVVLAGLVSVRMGAADTVASAPAEVAP